MMGKANTKEKKFQKAKSYFLPLTSYFSLKKGQVMLEFAFCMIILFLMMYAIVMIFRWVGLDLGQRQQAHDALLTAPLMSSLFSTESPLKQIDPYFYEPGAMNAVWAGD